MSNISKEFSWSRNGPAFHHMLRASGQAEVWHDFTDDMKFRQYGWRCSTNEDSYSNTTLIGNWSEERFDTRRTVALRRPLPHQLQRESQEASLAINQNWTLHTLSVRQTPATDWTLKALNTEKKQWEKRQGLSMGM
ncbi:hypothetical protein H4Q32_002422 [Labeo rohita]|uniref:Uncharacterized protein n=1 Tax=Labeo rohita TaxID=84645 RepID=A0ABQ8MPD5_LABRO|nr:hypothetical protein H4Q32_002422 [Labeo rohita]